VRKSATTSFQGGGRKYDSRLHKPGSTDALRRLALADLHGGGRKGRLCSRHRKGACRGGSERTGLPGKRGGRRASLSGKKK